MTWKWVWNTVCQAAAPNALSTLTPSAPSASFWRSATRRAMAAIAARSLASISPMSLECALGITSAWPRVHGLMSMKASVRSSSSIFVAGSSPATILQKMQSSAMRRRRLFRQPRVHHYVRPAVLDQLVAAQDALEREAGLLGHAAAGGVVRVDVQLHPVPAGGERPPRHLLNGCGRDAAPPAVAGDPVADLGPLVDAVAAHQGDRPDHG